ncbi:MAG TPA: hypothetical protein VL128_12985 [Candidatus Eisenbacteria bacterium]|nr:hypothetical protein [Candidatus Eisenbacteria bacterium]
MNTACNRIARYSVEHLAALSDGMVCFLLQAFSAWQRWNLPQVYQF